MALRQGNREQIQMLPPCIEEYVPQDAPVRVYDAFVDTLDLGKLGIECNPDKEGNPSYDPRSMLKLLIYGYSYGVRSSRKLEREVNYNLSFIWLMGGLKPDFKTIAEFRRKNKEAIKIAFNQCVQLCLKINLIDGNILFVDGSKMRANASIENSFSVEKAKNSIVRLEKKIEQLISDAEAQDRAEEGQSSLVKVNKDIKKAQDRKEQIKNILEELHRNKCKTLNTVDRECTIIHGRQGTHAGYNAQVVVDDKNGLIVSSDVVTANNDIGQFSGQIEKANVVMNKKCQTGVADSGYAKMDDLARTMADQIQVIVPTQRIVSKQEVGKFDKRNFVYNVDQDCYFCPMGHMLIRGGRTHRDSGNRYRITEKDLCLTCQNYGKCTKAKRGRVVERRDDEAFRESLENEYALSENQAIYNRRKEKIELVFGHIKRNLGAGAFLLRELEGTRVEISLMSICFNLRRMMTILGIQGLIRELRALITTRFSFFSLEYLKSIFYSIDFLNDELDIIIAQNS
jgi:transposase